MVEKGFDNEKYVRMQSQKIRDRIGQFGDKLYLEFGGKLFDDYHATRVLPGFEPDSKVKMLCELKDEAEIVIAICANAIEKSKKRGDLGITYDQEVLRLIDTFTGIGLYVGSVVITQYTGQPLAEQFATRLKRLDIQAYRHFPISGYPANTAHIVSEEGYGKNEYVETSRSLIVVTAPGPGSGKMAVCLSQLYHENRRKIRAGYAKYETFPIWNLPLKHPVNVAYEAATADLNDINMIDPFHLEAYGETTINYNRDVEIFPVLQAMFGRIFGQSPYKSPTDMGVNMAGHCITDDDVCKRAAKKELIRRFFYASCAVRQGLADVAEVGKIELLMNTLGVEPKDLAVVAPALRRAEETDKPAVAIELLDGRIVTGKTTPLLGASAAALLNALKKLADIPHDIPLISPIVIEPIQELKINHMGNRNPRLHTDEILIALSICAATNPMAAHAMAQLRKLKGCDAHATTILSRVDESVFKKIGVNITCEPDFEKKQLYHR